MLAYALRKAIEALAVCVTVSIATFALIAFTGDLATSIGGMEANRAEIERIRAFYGLDRSFLLQYLDWAGRALSGDLGTSFFSREPVLEMILRRLPVTLALGAGALLFGLVLAVPLGVIAAVRPNGWIDRACLAVSLVGQAMPNFWFALLLVLVFGVWLQVTPISGTETAAHFILPIVALGWYVMPIFMRLTRAGMIEALSSDYVRTARAKGLAPWVVLFKHALRNAALPVVAVAAVQLGALLGGSIVIESVFALNGIGLLAWNAIQRSDFPVIQAIVLVVSLLFVALNLVADLVNATLDPRLRRA